MEGLDLEFPTLDLDAIDTPQDTLVEEPQDTLADENVETDTPEAEDVPSEGTEEEQEPTDGRKLPDEVRKALKALRDSSPENAKAARALNDVYGREQAYKQVFPTVKDAVAAQGTLATVESYGGLDGIQATIAEIEEIDGLLQAGDSKAIDKIFQAAGDGFSKIAPAMLDKLQSSNPEAYSAAIRPHLVAAIGSSGLTDAFAAVMQAQQFAATPGASAEFKAKWEKDAATGLQKIHEYLSNLGKTPASTSATQPVQQNDAFTKREQELATKEAAQFNTEVGNLANSKMTSSLSKALAPYLRNELKSVGREGRADVVQGIYDEIAKLAKADKVYQTTKDNLFKSKTKNAANIAQHMSAKFESVVADATKAVVNRRYGKGAAVAPKTTSTGTPAPGGTGSVQKPILVKELPAHSEVDWSKTDDDMTIRGVRVLKSGKVIKLNR